jgi:hypothetical protein
MNYKMRGRLAIPLLFIPLIPPICFRNEGWLNESLEEKGGSPGIYEILSKHFSNLLRVIS